MPSLEFLAVLLGVVVGLAILFYAFVWSQPSSPCAGDMKPKTPKWPRGSSGGTWHRNPPPMPKPTAPTWRVPCGYPPPKKPETSPRDKFAKKYHSVGCPACGCKHQYGLDRELLDCYACGKTFDPLLDGRRYESYRRAN